MTETPLQQIENSDIHEASQSSYSRFLFLGIFWGVTCLAIVFSPDPMWTDFEYPITGFLVGSIIGHTTIICLWASIGQGSHRFRGILALLYIFGLWLAFVAYFAIHDLAVIQSGLILGAAIGLQAFLIFGLGWLARSTGGLSLIFQADLAKIPIQFQFKIKHVMILTIAIACFIALSRGLILSIVDFQADYGARIRITYLFFMATAAVLVTIPIASACVLPRHLGLGLFVALLGFAVITAIERLSYLALDKFSGGGPDFYHSLFINLFSALFVLIFSLGLRRGGYRLSIGKR